MHCCHAETLQCELQYGKFCAETNGTYSCGSCNTAGGQCCDNGSGGFCTDFLDCDSATNTCAEPTAQPCPVTASSSDNPSREREFLIDMGTTNRSIPFDYSLDFSTQGYISFTTGASGEVSLMDITFDEYSTLSYGAIGYVFNSNIVTVTVATDGSGDWDFTVECPEL